MSFRWGDSRVDVAGTQLECACFGPAPISAMTLVLLHEGLGSASLWYDFPKRLAQETGCGVFAFSRAGYGRSDPVPLPRPLDYMTREAVDGLPKLLNAIGVTKHCLIGHSDGATIAAIHAGLSPQAGLEGVALIAPHFFTEPVGLAAIQAARAAYEQGDLRDKLARHHDAPDIAFYGWNDAWLAPGFQDWNVEHVLDTIHVPALALQGQDDSYGTLRQINVVADRAPGPVTRVELCNCNHAPHRECPDVLLNHLVAFVSGIRGASFR